MSSLTRCGMASTQHLMLAMTFQLHNSRHIRLLSSSLGFIFIVLKAQAIPTPDQVHIVPIFPFALAWAPPGVAASVQMPRTLSEIPQLSQHQPKTKHVFSLFYQPSRMSGQDLLCSWRTDFPSSEAVHVLWICTVLQPCSPNTSTMSTL